MTNLLGILFLVPLATASLCLLAFRSHAWQRVLSVLGAFTELGFSLWLFWQVGEHGAFSLNVGNWPAPFGIVLVADRLSALMVLITALISLLVQVYSLGSMDRPREKFGYYPLIQILTLGIVGAFLTGDVF
ncbi:MAG: Na+/H+ antiporter subunit D, partial [Deltaproteobacteria bacterium]|nr:Na+/H+ antiporter subunit D [Deltaproteobacteria bacterium]